MNKKHDKNCIDRLDLTPPHLIWGKREYTCRPLGKHQRKLLKFAEKQPNWQSYARDQLTTRVVKSLRIRGLIEVNDFRQFKLL